MKALVLCSGGVDSTTLLAMAVKEHGADQVFALSIGYGQKHRKELEAAQAVSGYYKVKQDFLNLEEVFFSSNSSLLEHSTVALPRGSYGSQKEEQGEKPVSTYVPFRNGIFLSVAAGVALAQDCGILYYGAHQDDVAGVAYPDCSPNFVEAMDKAIFEGSGKQLHVKAPFLHLSKGAVVKMGLELGVPYELTWSCYEGGEKPCGVCGTCIDREKAFTENGVVDPLKKGGK